MAFLISSPSWLCSRCAGDLLQLTRDRRCAADQGLNCTNLCSIYHGEQGIGSACTYTAEKWSDCAQGLSCFQGICFDLCPSLTEGQACMDELGNSLGDCLPEADLVCDFLQSRTCIPLPKVGEPCHPGEKCAQGAFCELGICAPIPGLGKLCTSVCEDGLYCAILGGEKGYCAKLPVAGEPCAPKHRCAKNHACNLDLSICELRPAWVCSAQ